MNGQDANIDVWVTDADQPSAAMQDPAKVLQLQEKEKKRKYLKAYQQQHRAFTPFVTLLDGLLGLEARSVFKQLAPQLAVKWQNPYSQVCGTVMCRYMFCL